MYRLYLGEGMVTLAGYLAKGLYLYCIRTRGGEMIIITARSFAEILNEPMIRQIGINLK